MGGYGPSEAVLGLDAGTTSAKAVVMDRGGAVWAEAESDPIPTRSPEPGASEQDPEEIWRAVASAARAAVGGLPTEVRVAALAVAAQSGSVVPVRASGRAGPVITWMDSRSRDLVESWPPEVAERIRMVSGWTPTAGYGLTTIAYQMSRSGPVSRWTSVDDYLMHRLTGRWATNPSNASGMGLMDISARAWSPELCWIAGTDPSLLSEIVESGTAAGGLSPEAAASLGVPAETPVAAGGHDQACAALGLGAVEPGRMFLSAGTAWVLTAITDRACAGALDPRLNLSPHVVAGCWTVSESLGGLGAEIAEAAPEETRAVFERCAQRVAEALTRAADAGGGSLAGTAQATTGARSLAGIAQTATTAGATAGIAQTTTIAGNELILVGGGSNLPELVKIVAEVTGRTVITRPDASWPARGAALLAASALGWSLREMPEAAPVGGAAPGRDAALLWDTAPVSDAAPVRETAR